MRRLVLLTVVFILLMMFSSAMAQPFREISIVADSKGVSPEVSPYLANGRVMVPAQEVFEEIGASVYWNDLDKKIVISRDDHTVLMALYSNNAIVDGRVIRSSEFPTLVNDVPMVPARFVAENLMVCVEWDAARFLVELDSSKPPVRPGLVLGSRGDMEKLPLVVIDAGHGGKEPGAVHAGAVEKTLNLDIAKRLKKILDDNNIKNTMTRSDDSFVDLYDRSRLANNNNAGLFISIHNNASTNSNTHGIMTLYHSSSSQSKKLARIVQNQLVADLGAKNFGIVPRSNLAVLRTTRMPSIIAEIGYISNAAERSKLLEEDYRQKAAESLAKAIVKAFEQL